MSKQSGKYLLPLVLLLSLVVVLCACSGSGAKKVAINFAKALLNDANAKKAVSLMSEDLLEQTLEDTGYETKKVLIKQLDQELKVQRDSYKKVKIEFVDQHKIDKDYVEVYLSCTYKRSALFGLSETESTERITITVVKEAGKWRVDSF